jgi:hypothetical protein
MEEDKKEETGKPEESPILDKGSICASVKSKEGKVELSMTFSKAFDEIWDKMPETEKRLILERLNSVVQDLANMLEIVATAPPIAGIYFAAHHKMFAKVLLNSLLLLGQSVEGEKSGGSFSLGDVFLPHFKPHPEDVSPS